MWDTINENPCRVNYLFKKLENSQVLKAILIPLKAQFLPFTNNNKMFKMPLGE
jgi:hypothetical protein